MAGGAPGKHAGAGADIVCVSHLWWDWVWQRPQQLLSRLARRHRVFWIEEPHIEIGAEWDGFEVRERVPNVTVSRLVYRSDRDTFWQRLTESEKHLAGHPFAVSPHITEASLMFQSFAQPRLEREASDFVSRWRQGPLVLWLYHPLASPFIELLQPDVVVYDVMDELSAFRYAQPALRALEEELLVRADLVFAGGPSLWESKRRVRADAHLFPSGADSGHFARALDPELPLPDEVRDVPRPIVGFYGVVDERTDLELLTACARRRPGWTWLLVGPLLKIEESALPREPNLRHIGQQPYAALPRYLKAFDVAMMPFALNDSTRFISPTKTLEYMAAHRPIVSTPIPDVITLFGSVVRVADGPEAFVEQAEGALSEGPDERRRRRLLEDELVERYSWDSIVSEMERLLDDALARASAAER